MRNWLGRIALTAAMAFGLAASPAAAAVATYKFEDLTGTGYVGTLVLDDYTPGSASGTLVSFRLLTPLIVGPDGMPFVYELNTDSDFSLSSDLALTDPGEGGFENLVKIAAREFTFETGLPDPEGSVVLLWRIGCGFGSGTVCGGGDGPNVETGPPVTYSWTLVSLAEPLPPGVPEPMTWTLMIAGLGLAGARLRARRRSLA